ncbi:MAG: PhzF family phenazine biosynthesis protein [Nitriliruptoraceae bacterium]
MTRRRFAQVDVFGAVAGFGNPLAVVIDADGLSDGEMQRFARWTNLAETTFLLPPTGDDADYRVRIFTPMTELSFAGHPTLGSCHAWLAAGGTPASGDRIVQECGVGLVTLRNETDLAFAAPPLRRSGSVDADDTARILAMLRLDADDVVDLAWVDNGPGWVGVLLADDEAVLAVDPDPSAVAPLSSGTVDIGLAGFSSHPGIDLEVRALSTDDSGAFLEDPVTGSLNASLAQWLLATGRLAAPYIARQGTRIGRDGRIHITHDGADVWVAGRTTTLIEGTVTL